MTVGDFINKTTNKLKQVGSGSARLDAIVLLSDAWRKDKAWLLAHPNQKLPIHIQSKLLPKVAARVRHKPMAYIRGKQEFYGREFDTPFGTVLIPRPETEELIEQLKTILKHNSSVSKKAPWKVVDVGTGSGVIAITVALELPNTKVTAIDVSEKALEVAKSNAKKLGAKVGFLQGDLLTPLRVIPATEPESSQHKPGSQVKPGMTSVAVIIANLPYVDGQWNVSPETQFEPEEALFANDGGLGLIKKLVAQTRYVLKPGGHLLLEADPRQHGRIIDFAKDHGLYFVNQKDFALVFRRPPKANKVRA